MSGKNELPIPFRLTNIEVLQYSVFEETLETEGEIQDRVGIGFGGDIDKFLIGTSILYQIKKGDNPILKIQAACYFEIEETAFNDQLLKNEHIVLPQFFASHLGTIGIGTVRGILFAKTESTPFNDYIMGLVNVEEIVKDEVVI